MVVVEEEEEEYGNKEPEKKHHGWQQQQQQQEVATACCCRWNCHSTLYVHVFCVWNETKYNEHNTIHTQPTMNRF